MRMIVKCAAHKHDVQNLFARLIIPDDSGFTLAEALSSLPQASHMIRFDINFENTRKLNKSANPGACVRVPACEVVKVLGVYYCLLFSLVSKY